MTKKADASAKRAALIVHICGLDDAALAALRAKALAERFGVYWLVAATQLDIETARRRERVAAQ